MSENLLIYKIGLSIIPKIGNITAKKLVAYTGSVENVFREKKYVLEKIPGVGSTLAKTIKSKLILQQAEKELNLVYQNNIQVLFYLDKSYPQRLNHCNDAPVILYQKGNCNLNNNKVICIVGTRNASSYGKEMCEKLISGLRNNGHNVLLVSGLAYGIDICAHKAAIQENLETAAVLGHGLYYLYPSLHFQTARKIIQHGCLLTEFNFSQKPEPSFFVKRNRIVAGMCDATIVIESGRKGGALITADLANSYNRDVFAVPGNIGNPYSEGCNFLIKTNKAALIENVSDIEYLLGWDVKENNPPIQKVLFEELSEAENKIVQYLQSHSEAPFDHIFLETKLPVSIVSSNLLNLEFKGMVKSLPGKIYKLI